MKRVIAILLVLCLVPLSADAQWYLFPGNKKKQEQKKNQKAAADSAAVRDNAAGRDSTAYLFPGSFSGTSSTSEGTFSPDANDDDAFFLDFPSTINVALILPFKASSDKPSSNYLEMYCGALLALRDLGAAGTGIRLNVIDSSDGSRPLSKQDVEESDVIIGPVSYDDIRAALPMCGRRKMLISPLEPKTATLVDSCNVIQSPVPWTCQIDELVKWAGEDMQAGEELVVIFDNSPEGNGEQSAYLKRKLAESGLRYRRISSVDELEASRFRRYRVMIASDSDSFLTGAARSTAIAAARNGNITLYSTSRIRSSIGQNVTDLYNANTRLTAAYYIDYDSQAVKDFVLAYRALFNSEPGSFAFQGYDTMHYYVSMCAKYGRRWYRKLPDYSERGLQSDFRFDRMEGSGKINVAVRRIIYNSDLSTTLL